MYGIYIIAIAFAGVATLFGIPALILWALLKKYREERDRITFYEMRYDADAKKGYETYAKKAGTTYRWALVFLVVFVVCAFLAISFAGGGAITLKGAEREYEQFLATQDVFEQVYVAENEFENIKLTETIIAMNRWMVRAKAGKKTYGCFSQYYFLNVEDLEPTGKR